MARGPGEGDLRLVQIPNGARQRDLHTLQGVAVPGVGTVVVLAPGREGYFATVRSSGEGIDVEARSVASPERHAAATRSETPSDQSATSHVGPAARPEAMNTSGAYEAQFRIDCIPSSDTSSTMSLRATENTSVDMVVR